VSDNSNEESDIKKPTYDKPDIFKLFLNPKVLIGVVLIYAGLGLPVLLKTESNLLLLLKEQAPLIIGVLSALVGFALTSSEISKIKRARREERFVDVDEARTGDRTGFQEKILNEIKTLKAQSENLSAEKIESLISEISEKRSLDNKDLYESFENYFSEIKTVLVDQAHTADKKASILLDKGTAYSKGGITFFIVTIIAWQVLSGFYGFKEQYIYGIVSCSLLFIFIEFLAAWFLKQYRHFIDTSTYLIKVKSIFDKYMLSFLTIKSIGINSDNEDEKYKSMLKVLEEDIKWPETYLLKHGDISFAKEAMETMTHFAKAMKSEVKDKNK